jgi:hypothetical protein
MQSTSYTADILQEARQSALQGQLYDSKGTRRAMANNPRPEDAFGGKTPSYPWQLDAAETIVLRVECVVVAGPGAEKTVPLALPLFAHD